MKVTNKQKYNLLNRVIKKTAKVLDKRSYKETLSSLYQCDEELNNAIMFTDTYHALQLEKDFIDFDGLKFYDGKGDYPISSLKKFFKNYFTIDFIECNFDLKYLKEQKKLKKEIVKIESSTGIELYCNLEMLINVLTLFDNEVVIGINGTIKPIAFRHKNSKSKAIILPIRIVGTEGIQEANEKTFTISI